MVGGIAAVGAQKMIREIGKAVITLLTVGFTPGKRHLNSMSFVGRGLLGREPKGSGPAGSIVLSGRSGLRRPRGLRGGVISLHVPGPGPITPNFSPAKGSPTASEKRWRVCSPMSSRSEVCDRTGGLRGGKSSVICLACDGSYREGMGGMAVIAPRGLPSAECVAVEVIPGRSLEAHVAFATCRSASEAEMMALAMAVEIALCLLVRHPGERVEILTDSLNALNGVLYDEGALRGKGMIRDLLAKGQGAVMLSKVKAHRGNRLNELADLWSKQARRRGERDARYGSLYG